MSRSYKKTLVCKDQGTRWMKRQASKAVRRYAEDIRTGAVIRNCSVPVTFAITVQY